MADELKPNRHYPFYLSSLDTIPSKVQVQCMECETCFALTVNPRKHAAWHLSRNDPPGKPSSVISNFQYRHTESFVVREERDGS